MYSLQLTALLQWTVRQAIDAETNATSVERLLAFVNIVPEKSITVPVENANIDTVESNSAIAGAVAITAVSSGSLAAAAAVGDLEMATTNVSQNTSNNAEENKYALVNADSHDNKTNAAVWPRSGEIRFRNLKLRYRPELSLILHGECDIIFVCDCVVW